MASNQSPLDDLLAKLETLTTRTAPKDAIDRVLEQPARSSKVRSLREHDTVVRFRQELSDGLIRVDTANRLLRLVAEAMEVAVV